MNSNTKADVIIIGQGPAGLSASIYTGRAGLNTIIVGCEPSIAGEYVIDNYLGFPSSITGKELIDLGIEQSKKFGTYIISQKVLSIHTDDGGGYTVKTEDEELTACSVILSTGISRKKPGIDNLDQYEGKGVSYCVSCDGFFFRGKKVVVVGEGNYAANQAVELLEYTNNVSICTMGKEPDFNKNFREMLKKSGIPVIQGKIKNLTGEQKLSGIVFDDEAQQEADGLFIAMGDASSLDFARSLGIFSRDSYIDVDDRQQTNVPGIFAAGDCTGGFLQISVAVGEGAKAARSAIEFVKNICR